MRGFCVIHVTTYLPEELGVVSHATYSNKVHWQQTSDKY